MKAMHNTPKHTPTMNNLTTVQMKTLPETCNKKAHNKIIGIHRAKQTQKEISIRGHFIQKR